MRKIVCLMIALLLLVSAPAFGAVKVDWEGTVSGSNSPLVTGLVWDTGFQLHGDWALGEKFTFYLWDELAMNSVTKEWVGSLDRCYLRYESGPFRANLGRQGVSWGIGWFFRPTDLITPIMPLAQEDTRPGKDLAVLRWSTSDVTAVDVIAGDRLYAARGELRLKDTNLRFMGVSSNQPDTENTIGWDAQGGLGGLYTEGKFAWRGSAFQDGKTMALVGWRKTVWTDRQLFIEYLRNNDFPGASMYSGQNYLVAGLQIPYDELTSFSITGVGNLDDGGLMLYGIVDLQMSDNLDLRGVIGALAGPEGSEFMTLSGGARWNVMVQVKYYF